MFEARKNIIYANDSSKTLSVAGKKCFHYLIIEEQKYGEFEAYRI